ncbi:hypothetical protein [Vibrio parahaemolyticus]|uniref:hypothetical protein n=1 Tax=Vibrio parahaemolyticus TaxID=670 RepID=UPI0003FD3429|nr:hypothetical protein [Vibrio parahaemolyticus]HAS7010776.1 hypothetical protein [Vibrio parahaemolyticus]HCE2651565.1 hypothetical protein [Vibrio parahaemolyticus]HCE5036196.1 hypothetical protein [Vibrio parahaemolyticus]HCG8974454.1 hypothetical protein [Vibrio parahaemolyticus]HCG9764985.1 hypothetical protein [Vibrio parahaemolyticus]
MVESLENIANAIESLQSNPYKDYIFPVGSVLVSGAVGILASYYAIHKQESNRAKIGNIESANKLLLHACNARDNLIAIKSNYFHQLDGHPITRLLVIPPIFFDQTRVDVDISKLSFLHVTSETNQVNKWLNIVRINGVFKNYNFLLDIWDKRNNLYEEFVLPIVSSKHGSTINHTEFIEQVGLGKIAEMSDITEQVISLTDDLLIEVCCFLEAFSLLSKDKLDSTVSKKYRPSLNFKLPTVEVAPDVVDLMSLTESLDYRILTKVLHVPKEEAEQRYRKIYTH